jgi:mono/diheme cytochrome c family protein
VRRLWAILSLMAVIAAVGLAAGCVDSSEEAASTPANAPTVANSAQQTDSSGKTVPAPGQTTEGAETGGAQTGGASTGGGAAAAGDAAAGMQVFASTCTSCHLNDGNDAGGVGPKLAAAGLTADVIRNQVVNGGAVMPAGLVSGTDLDNVVAYVVSIQ